VTGGWYSGIKGSALARALTSAELYDPVTNTWSAAGNLTTARYLHTATLLPNGKVLIVGGWGGNALAEALPSAPIPTSALSSTELYDPANKTWSTGGNLETARYSHTATLLPNGKVLLAGGGNCLNCAELYDPVGNNWSKAKNLGHGRYNHTATLLPTGKVLVAGGSDGFALVSTELYDPATDNWSATVNLNIARSLQNATRLLNGSVLVVGGWGESALAALPSTELFK
jgi:N-acetylneuraminic acid mutarotase